MNEKMKNEIEKYAETLDVSVEQANTDYEDIVSLHELNVEDENEFKIARSLFRSKHGQQMALKKRETNDGETKEFTGETFSKTVNGFFYAVEDARDWEATRRNTLQAEYARDSVSCVNSGSVAVAVQQENGTYEITLVKDGESVTKTFETLNDSAIEVDDNQWIIPVDNRKAWANGQANKSYGKPSPKESWSRRLFFIGKIDDGEYGTYQLRMGGEHCKDFKPTTFSWYEFMAVPNSNNPSILSGRKDGSTNASLKELETNEEIIPLVTSLLGDKVTELVALDTYHSDNSHKQSHERIVVTDGNVASMNLQQTTNGNQTLFLSDLNSDFDYEGEGYSSVPCWVPSYINIDFGIGSNVIVCGRTSQGTDKNTGELRNVTINVLGLYVIDRHGSADVEETEGDNEVWF